MEMMHFDHPTYALRPWRTDDAPSLVRHANNRNVSRNLRDAFPYPYTQRDAESWLRMIRDTPDNLILAIVVHGEAAGGIALHGQGDVYRFNAELGYWLSQKYWGRGIVSHAVGEMLALGFSKRRWLRIFAAVFEHNPASMRVLEKNGFRREAIHKRVVMKEGVLMDECLYAILREDWEKDRDLRPEGSGRAADL